MRLQVLLAGAQFGRPSVPPMTQPDRALLASATDSPADVKFRRDDTSPSPPGAQGMLLGTHTADKEVSPVPGGTGGLSQAGHSWGCKDSAQTTLSQPSVQSKPLSLHSRRRTKAAHSLLCHPGNRSFGVRDWSPLTGRGGSSKESENHVEPHQGPSSCCPKH